MLKRKLFEIVQHALTRQASVALIGPPGRQDHAGVGADPVQSLWVRGGFPDSFLALDDRLSMDWRKDLLRTYLERDVPMFGSRIPAETLSRF